MLLPHVKHYPFPVKMWLLVFIPFLNNAYLIGAATSPATPKAASLGTMAQSSFHAALCTSLLMMRALVKCTSFMNGDQKDQRRERLG